MFSFSKGYGMASWRVGYMVAPESLWDAINKIQDTELVCPPAISQHAALAALKVGAGLSARRPREARQAAPDDPVGAPAAGRALRHAGRQWRLLLLHARADVTRLDDRG